MNINCGETMGAYECQYFGFSPKAFTDGTFNTVYDYLERGLKDLAKFLISKYGNLMPEEDIKQASEKILREYSKSLDKPFDKFESYLQSNILLIPENAVLPEDICHTEEGAGKSKHDLLSLGCEIRYLEENIAKEKVKKDILLKQQAQQDHVLRVLKDFELKASSLLSNESFNVAKCSDDSMKCILKKCLKLLLALIELKNYEQ